MEQKIGRILAVDDNEDILFALKLLLRPHVEIIETLTLVRSASRRVMKKAGLGRDPPGYEFHQGCHQRTGGI
jgi:hypothetical protein